jgi:sarcosine oxidase
LSFDVAIVGLGAMGSAAAYQLARRGAHVLGIDRYAPPHNRGSTHGGTRITRKAIGEGDAYVPMVLRSYELFREIEALTGERLLVETGGLWISSDERRATTHVENFFENTLAAAKRYGITHEVMEAAEARRRFPQFSIRDNEVAYYEPEAGYLRPEACVAAQLSIAARHGAKLHTGERVLRFEERAQGVAIHTDRGNYLAAQVILAAGPWLRELVPLGIGSRFTVTRQVQYWFGIQDPDLYRAPRFPVFIWELQEASHVIYGFPTVDGLTLKIATEEYDREVALGEEDRQPAANGAEIRRMHEELVAPYLPGVGPECVRTATCLYTATAGFRFAIDRLPGHRRVILAAPCSGHGFKHSAAIGEALAQLALGEAPTLDLSSFRVE